MKSRSFLIVLAFLGHLTLATAFAATVPVDHPPSAAPASVDYPISTAALGGIADIVNDQIRAGHIPGAVVLIGHDGRVVYRRAFGYVAPGLSKARANPRTMFDLASLTKVVATTSALLQLCQGGKISLDAPIASYWPEFAAGGKQAITVREALTHYSGLPPDLDTDSGWRGYRTAMAKIVAMRPVAAPGTRYIYSDVNFEVLGELVRRVSGEPLDVYCRRHIFAPLGMTETCFRPPISKRGRIAPTGYVNGTLRWGEVNDPTAWAMGGVAGHAGLFSTADDLAKFAQAMLDGGRRRSVRILDASTIDEMITPSSPDGADRLRGLGWDLGPPLAANRYDLPPAGSFGHTGYTGTMLWIDPTTRTYVIVLTNRVYLQHSGDAEPLRTRILALVSEAIGRVSRTQVLAREPGIALWCARSSACGPSKAAARVATGADVLESENFAPLAGLRVGLITNRSGADAAGNPFLQVISGAPGLRLSAIFTPEHGLSGLAEGKVASTQSAIGLPIFSLYGETMRPSSAMLEGVDALVFDTQDSGARFYTYETTMAYAMEAAARRGIDFYVLDRPNPLSAEVVEGPVMDPTLKSFTGYFPLPTRHGMTMGELAEMFNRENHIGARLHVIRMRGYHRYQWYDDTGLPWIPPSPNLRTLAEATLYPGVGMIEGANVSVGRGTDEPFEIVGAPWINAAGLAAYLEGRGIAGVRFEPASFTPSADRYANRVCRGVRIRIVDRNAIDTPELGVELIAALRRLYPQQFELDATLGMIGSRKVLDEIKSERDPKSIAEEWQPALERFRLLRAKYLLY